MSHLNTTAEFFSRIFNDEFHEIIIKFTNKRINSDYLFRPYSRQFLSQRSIRLITLNEIKAFVGILILCGIGNRNHAPVNEIWSPASEIHYLSLATAAMSRDRFKFISNTITFDDCDENIRKERAKTVGKFHKFEEVFCAFKNNIKLIEPSSNLCGDEELYACRCRVAFMQYMKSKPARYGLKYWCLVDVKTTYLLDVNIYLG